MIEFLASKIRRGTCLGLIYFVGLFFLMPSMIHADPALTVINSDGSGQQTVSLSGAHSFDPDGQLIDYTWTVNNVLVGSGYGPSVKNLIYDFSLGTTTVQLTVRDDAQVLVSTTARVIVLPQSSGPPPSSGPLPVPSGLLLAGHSFTRVFSLKNFSFDPPYGSFAAITYDSLTQTYFVTDNVGDAIFEIQSNGTPIRTIDISGMKRNGIATADAEGIAWMHDQTFALALHDGKEIAVVSIAPGATTLSRSQAAIYDVSSGPGKPKGLAYSIRENAFYWVAKDSPKAVIKAQISGGQWKTIWTKLVDNLPVSNLADVAVFPKLSPYLFLISESSNTIMEVDMTGDVAVTRSSMSIKADSIPQAGGLTFGPDGKLYVVGKHAPNVPQNDFSVFDPSPALGNQPPWVFASVPPVAYGDGQGSALVRVDASESFDPEGDPITRYRWTMDNAATLNDGSNPVATLTISTNGIHVLNLDVFSWDASDSTQSSRADFSITVNLSQTPPGDVPLPVQVSSRTINYIHPGSLVQHAEFVFDMSSSGHSEIYIFDPLGREVKKIKSEDVPAGRYAQVWDLTNENGTTVASGVYFAIIKTPGQTQKEKVVVVR